MKQSMYTMLLKAERLLGNRGFGRIPGVQWFKRTLLRATTPKQRIIRQVDGFRMYLNPADSGVSREILGAGGYEEFELSLFRAALRPGMVLMDVGANIGYYSLAAASQTQDEATIYAFEPEPQVLASLHDNIALNSFKSILPFDRALADKRGVLRLNVDQANMGKHSLVQADGGNSRQIEIQTLTMDEFVREHGITRVDLIKLDVEGAEGMVLAGARDTIAKFGPVIFMEYTPDWLVRAGTDTQRLFADFTALGYRFDLIDTRERCWKRVDYAELERLRTSTKWIFQANLILTRGSAA
jgi:FkbM family methyltransferase